MSENILKNLLFALVVLIVAGVLYFSQANSNDDNLNLVTNELGETFDETPKGKISGSFTFPSERIPTDLSACAEKINGGFIECSDEQIIDEDRFIYGQGYEIELPPGEYYVYTNDGGSAKAYHNGYMTKVDKEGWPDYDITKCKTDYQPIKIVVRSNEEVANIDVGDWYYQSACVTQ